MDIHTSALLFSNLIPAIIVIITFYKVSTNTSHSIKGASTYLGYKVISYLFSQLHLFDFLGTTRYLKMRDEGKHPHIRELSARIAESHTRHDT